ncbi:MAG TPA: TolC family protein, partial [Vicinamibacteria bacterium]|nr:TolC family protein [Vicinamibacteria bacterium]
MLGAPPLLAQTTLPYPSLPADPALPALAQEVLAEEAVQPGPDVPTMSLAEAVAAALESNHELLLASDDVAVAHYRYSAALGQFYPKLTPRYQRSSDDSAMDLSAQQRLPWTGGSLTANASFGTFPGADSPITRSSRLSLTLSQPLLRGFGPNASLFDLRNSRRQRERSERSLELSRQRLAVDVARRFYQVIEQRTLLAVARQSLHRTQNLQRASEARLEVGLVSKLDVYRAQLQASQAQDAMLRAETALQDALEGFRGLLGLHPGAPVEPAAVALTTDLPPGPSAALPVLVQRALATRLDMHETRDQVGDARRGASLARQNLLPQLDLNLGVSKEGFGTSFSSAWTADERVNVFLTASFPVERSADLAEKAVAQLSLAGMERTLR